ncbi:hypothetical protein [Leptotrichia sp. OH3620_COT-345]|uniref:hypothetical protein n=1 Tax=Leptotrichia sp. OH3620_COT-345 TaxID=2491048 RepID=UPI0013159D69|nr:hypothetical protein [Leptotrichia sp. OH3620_COT-345]
MKIEVKEPITLILFQTGETVKYDEIGMFEIENIDLRMERIIAQSNGKIKIFV